MKTSSGGVRIAVALVLVAMAALMSRPLQEESATADEPCILAAGYSYWLGYGFRMHPDEPPLAKMWSALPLLTMSIRVSPESEALLNGSFGHPLARTWGTQLKPAQQLFPEGRDSWYFWPWYEGSRWGELLVYRDNDGERLLAAGRWMQVMVTLCAGMLVFGWARELAGPEAGLLALLMWGFNPVVLAHGHLIQTDAAAALLITAALWTWSRFLLRPAIGRAIIAGAACGAAVATKITAILLLPVCVVLLAARFVCRPAAGPRPREWLRCLISVVAAGYVVLLIAYAPHWSPPPALSEEQAVVWEVPRWFRSFRLLFVPADFFKAVALALGSARGGHHLGYLFGEWSTSGWWYYYPVAFALKSPIPWLLLCALGVFRLVKPPAKVAFEQLVPWIGAAMLFAATLTNKMNIGVRHLLPVYALVSVGVAARLANGRGVIRVLRWVLCGWLVGLTLWAHPFYLEYFNEFVGGSRNGYRYLLDSNLDWGQDAKRLKQYMVRHGIEHIYLEYFGPQKALEYYRVAATRVSAEQARQLRDGILVVSAMELMRPEWSWLRQQRPPTDRVGCTLFVYKIRDGT
jgi:hypothetical protein